MKLEDYALIGDLRTTALVGRTGSVDWLCLPRTDSPACFAALLGTEEHGRWLICPSEPVSQVSRRYRDGTLILETDFHTDNGAVRLIDFMPLRQGGAPQLVRIVEGLHGEVPMSMQFVARLDYGSLIPWVEPDGRRHRRTRRSQCPSSLHDDRAARRGLDHAGRVHHQGGNAGAPFAHVVPVLRRAAAGRGSRLGTRPYRRLVARVVLTMHLQRRVARRGAALADHAEGAHRRGDRRDRRRSHHVAAGGARRRAQLGLPLLLDARLRPDPRRAALGRVRRRGTRLRPLGAQSRRRRRFEAADHVRDRRPALPGRARARLASGLRGIATGEDRQRRCRAVPARRLRRGRGRRVRDEHGHRPRRRGRLAPGP